MISDTDRTEAFSDGVFAIAITLLILEIRVPHPGDGSGLWAELVALWPSYLAFVLSFFVVLIMWVNHHELMRLVRRVDYPFLFANGLLLLTVTYVPFPTAVLAQHLNTQEATTAVAFYCGSFIGISLTWSLLFATMVWRRLLRPEVTPETVTRVRRAYAVGPVVYAVSTGVAFAYPLTGLALNTSLWLLWIRLCYRSTHHGTEAVDAARAQASPAQDRLGAG